MDKMDKMDKQEDDYAIIDSPKTKDELSKQLKILEAEIEAK